MRLTILSSQLRVLARRYLSSLPDHRKVTMPKVSPTMTEGKLISWKKREGDPIVEGEDIADVESDKATIPISAREDGFIAKIFVQEDTANIPLGKLLAITVEEEEHIAAFKDYQNPDEENASSMSAQPPGYGSRPTEDVSDPLESGSAASKNKYKGPIGPAVLRLLNEYPNLNLDQVTPTGPKGRILKGDVLAAIESGSAFSSSTDSETAPDEILSPESHVDASEPSEKVTKQPEPGQRIKHTDAPLTSMRKAIAKRLSKTSVPHQYTSSSFELDALLKLRKHLNSSNESLKISVNDFIIKAVGLALRQVSAMNVRWDKKSDGPVPNDKIDVSMAVALEGGLITPIVTNADRRGLTDIAKLTKELTAKAREGTLEPEEYEGGCFGVSNMGMLGVSHFSAIINPPHSGILAIGAPGKWVKSKQVRNDEQQDSSSKKSLNLENM